jgi:hypothetical protein
VRLRLTGGWGQVHSLAFGLAEEKVTYTLLGTTLEVMHAATGANDRMGMALVGTMVLSFVLFFPLIRLATQVRFPHIPRSWRFSHV